MFLSRMSLFSVNITLHHHGYFASLSPSTFSYVNEICEVIEDVDPDLFSFWDLEDYAKQYGYEPECKVYFKADGHSFKKGFRILFDDASVRDMINLCLPYGMIDLFVDHTTTEIRSLEIPKTPQQTTKNSDDEQLGYDSDDESEDSDYEVDGEYSETDSDDMQMSEGFENSDDELVDCRKMYKSVKDDMSKGTQGGTQGGPEHVMNEDSDESAFNNDELRSIGSSSEDENNKIGYVGPPIKK